jgi:hypothetical protein
MPRALYDTTAKGRFGSEFRADISPVHGHALPPDVAGLGTRNQFVPLRESR